MPRELAVIKVLRDSSLELTKTNRIKKSSSIEFNLNEKPPGKVILVYNIDPEGGKTRKYAIYHKKEIKELKKRYEDVPEWEKAEYMYKYVEEISLLIEGNFDSGVKRLLWETVDGEKFKAGSNTLYFQSSTGGIEVSDVILFYKKEVPHGESAEEVVNYVLWEENFKLELANKVFSWNTTLKNPRIESGLKAILGYCANPVGDDSNLLHRIFVNNKEIKESRLTSTIARNLIECFDTETFNDYENHNFKFEVIDGRGEMDISDGLLWYPHDASSRGVTSDYHVVEGTDDPIFLDTDHSPDTKTKHFDIPDDILTNEKAMVGCKMNPTGADNLQYSISVNDNTVWTGTYDSGHIRTRWQWFPGDYLNPGEENKVVCAVTGGKGTLKISDLVVWYKRRLSRQD